LVDFIFNLDPFVGSDKRGDERRIKLLDVFGGLAVRILLASRQVRLRALGEEMEENGHLSRDVDDDGPVPSSSPVTRPGDTLLDEELADLSRDLAPVRTGDGIP